MMTGYMPAMPQMPTIIPVPKKKNSNKHSFIELLVTLLVAGFVIYIIYTLLSPTSDDGTVDVVTEQIQNLKQEYLESSTTLYIAIGILVLIVIGISYAFYKRNAGWVGEKTNLENIVKETKHESSKIVKEAENMKIEMEKAMDIFKSQKAELEKEQTELKDEKNKLNKQRKEFKITRRNAEKAEEILRAELKKGGLSDGKIKEIKDKIEKINKEGENAENNLNKIKTELEEKTTKLEKVKESLKNKSITSLEKAMSNRPDLYKPIKDYYEKYATEVFHAMTRQKFKPMIKKGLIHLLSSNPSKIDISKLTSGEKKLIADKFKALKVDGNEYLTKNGIIRQFFTDEQYKKLDWENYKMNLEKVEKKVENSDFINKINKTNSWKEKGKD